MSSNLCANGCGSFVPDKKLNYCDNCFDVLLAEEQAAITPAKRLEATYSNTTNPGENWVRAELSTITLEEWISMVRRNDRASRSRKMESLPLSFSELLDIVRRNDLGKFDNMESSSTGSPPLVISSGSDEGSRSEEVNGSAELELARVIIIFPISTIPNVLMILRLCDVKYLPKRIP
ncbi:hypothetical protein Pint_28522 [Pistacia integerrima]|uniref:Uncharacterized protein n=1 Tax=Pistacia integerrima TaxID=434235 RepID=A0ACC0YS47_9ROSI|nr:hypothetical protein Pint_28522 [Pistacia integerrima]